MNNVATHDVLIRDGSHTLAYCRTEGEGPAIVFCGGFRSDMTGSKAVALEDFCRERGQAFIRFDYFGHGASSGAFEEGTIGRWKDDALAVLDRLTAGPQILVGSSMGGWIALLLALERPERIAGLIGIAAAPDFTEALIWDAFNEKQKKELQDSGAVHLPPCYDETPYPITRLLIEEGRNHLLLARERLAIHCPVRLLHGMQDEDVPWNYALKLCEKIASPDVEVHLVKDAKHRMSEPAQLALLTATVAKLCDKIARK